jgi:DNA replication and repair protein RecF
MRVDSIYIENFRKLSKGNFEFSDSFDIIVGQNGSGKTTILEAIYLLSTGKSFITNHILNCVNFSADFFLLSAKFEKQNGVDSIDFLLGEKKKELRYNTQKITSFSEIIGNYPVLLLNYTLSDIIKGGPDKRRDFLNHSLIFTDHDYYKALLRYYAMLDRRNALLKSNKASMDILSVFSEEMVSLGVEIQSKRENMINEIQLVIDELFLKVSGEKVEIKIKYFPSPVSKLNNLESIKEERAKKRTLYGIQLDDISIRLDGKETREYSSLGEAYSLAFSLRFAEGEIIKKKKHEIPIILIDDFFADLDELRRSNILKLLSSEQVFITTLSTKIIPPEIIDVAKIFML